MAEITELKASNMVSDRCIKWMKLQDYSYTEDTTAKQKSIEFDYDDCYNTDSEFDSVSVCDAKRRRVGTLLKDEILNLTCEWKECSFHSKHMEQFMRHVSSHIPSIQVSIKDDNEVYVCQWKDCLYDSDIGEEMIRHVNYHAYHTKLKSIGSNVRERIKLPVSVASKSLCKSCLVINHINAAKHWRITIVLCVISCRNVVEIPIGRTS